MNELSKIEMQKKYDEAEKRIEYLETVLDDYDEANLDHPIEIKEEISNLEDDLKKFEYMLELAK